jgi:anthranilate synthase component 1
MDKIIIETITTELSPDRVAEPLSVYDAAAARLGKRHCFLLESLSGPARDRRGSTVGLHRLFGLRVTHGRLDIHGPVALSAVLAAALSEALGADRLDGTTLRFDHGDEVWTALRAINALFAPDGRNDRVFGFFGYFGYDTAGFIERLPRRIPDDSGLPVISLDVFQSYAVYQPDGSARLIINNAALWEARGPADYADLLVPAAAADSPPALPVTREVRHTVDRETYLAGVATALENIRLGDIYQIQLGHEIHITTDATPGAVYRRLRQNNPSPYMFLFATDDVDVIGASPELFVRLRDGVIEMRPIAGTVGKRPGASRDELVRELTGSVKETAEHVMLVDLCRNDIGRVCAPGTLEVEDLMVVEEYSHLFHMISNTVGRMDAGIDKWDVVKATFPAGTMSGAPKIRAMELIEEIEASRRGIYAGAVGLIGFDDSMDTALCIRMAVRQDGVYHLRASAGIVADSDPEKEWAETFYKMSSVYRAVTGEELMK